jgi:WD40 repeat protein
MIYAVEWFPDGKRFAGGFMDGTVYVYARDGQLQCKHTFEYPSIHIHGLAVVSNSQVVAIVSTATYLYTYQLCMIGVDGNALSVLW